MKMENTFKKPLQESLLFSKIPRRSHASFSGELWWDETGRINYSWPLMAIIKGPWTLVRLSGSQKIIFNFCHLAFVWQLRTWTGETGEGKRKGGSTRNKESNRLPNRYHAITIRAWLPQFSTHFWCNQILHQLQTGGFCSNAVGEHTRRCGEKTAYWLFFCKIKFLFFRFCWNSRVTLIIF